MGVTVRIDENESIRVTEDSVEARPPDRLTFGLEGTITMTEQLLSGFEGTTLNPVRIEISTAGSRTVTIDLTEDPSLRLESMDVGLATPDTDDLARGLDTLSSSITDPTELADSRPAALAFTVEGSIRDVSGEALEALSEDDPTLESFTFAVEDPIRSDGGSADDVLLELTLFGYGITVRRDGTIVVGNRGRSTGIGLP